MKKFLCQLLQIIHESVTNEGPVIVIVKLQYMKLYLPAKEKLVSIMCNNNEFRKLSLRGT